MTYISDWFISPWNKELIHFYIPSTINSNQIFALERGVYMTSNSAVKAGVQNYFDNLSGSAKFTALNVAENPIEIGVEVYTISKDDITESIRKTKVGTDFKVDRKNDMAVFDMLTHYMPFEILGKRVTRLSAVVEDSNIKVTKIDF